MTHKVTCSDETISLDLGPLETVSPVISDALKNDQSIILPFDSSALKYLIKMSLNIYIPIDPSDGLKRVSIIWPRKEGLPLLISAIRLADFLMLKPILKKFVKIVVSRSVAGKANFRNPTTLTSVTFFGEKVIKASNFSGIDSFNICLLTVEQIMSLGYSLIYKIASKLPAKETKAFLNHLDNCYPESNFLEQMRNIWDEEFVLRSMTSLKKNTFFSLERCGKVLIKLSFYNPSILKLIQETVEEDSVLWSEISCDFASDLAYTIQSDSNQELIKTKEEFMNHILNHDWLCRLNANLGDRSHLITLLLFAESNEYGEIALKRLIDNGYSHVISAIINRCEDSIYEIVEEIFQ